MQTKQIIFTFFFLFFTLSTLCKVKNQVEKTSCSQNQKQILTKFYNQNFTKYRFLSLPEDFAEEDCFTLQLRDRNVLKTVIFMDTITISSDDKNQLVLSIYDPSRGYEFETNKDLEIMDGSFNALYLEEEQNDKGKARIETFLGQQIMEIFKYVDAHDYFTIFEYLRLCRMLGFEKVIDVVYVNLATNVIQDVLPTYKKAYFEHLANTAVHLQPQIQQIMSQKFEKLFMDENIQDELEHMVEHEPSKLLSNYQMIVNNLLRLTTKNGKAGPSTLAQTVNQATNQMGREPLLDFLTRFHRFVDKSKPIDWVHPSFNQNLDDLQVKKNLVSEMKEINEHQFQFYMVELFAMLGKSILSSVDKKAGIIELAFSSKDRCMLTDFEMTEIFEKAVENLWLLETTNVKEPRKMLRACVKKVEGDQEFFVFKINPTGKSRCEIVVRRLDSEDEQMVVREVEVLLDTHELYSYGNSCLRDTNRQKVENVAHPGTYKRLLR